MYGRSGKPYPEIDSSHSGYITIRDTALDRAACCLESWLESVLVAGACLQAKAKLIFQVQAAPSQHPLAADRTLGRPSLPSRSRQPHGRPSRQEQALGSCLHRQATGLYGNAGKC